MKRLAATACLAVVLWTTSPGAALASCAAPPPVSQAIAEAQVVFVGAVVETASDGRWATVEVTEVWKGDAAEVVEVRGGPEDPAGPIEAASSVDRTYRRGETYLFLPYAAEGDDVFLDDSCSSTTRFGSHLAHLRPAGAATAGPREPAAEPLARPSPPPWWGAVAVAAVAAGAWAWRRHATA